MSSALVLSESARRFDVSDVDRSTKLLGEKDVAATTGFGDLTDERAQRIVEAHRCLCSEAGAVDSTGRHHAPTRHAAQFDNGTQRIRRFGTDGEHRVGRLLGEEQGGEALHVSFDGDLGKGRGAQPLVVDQLTLLRLTALRDRRRGTDFIERPASHDRSTYSNRRTIRPDEFAGECVIVGSTATVGHDEVDRIPVLTAVLAVEAAGQRRWCFGGRRGSGIGAVVAAAEQDHCASNGEADHEADDNDADRGAAASWIRRHVELVFVHSCKVRVGTAVDADWTLGRRPRHSGA